ncbi:MAG: biopolymer transporter ExbB [Bacteroidetes bacterium CG2_30_33_31]|nr:MAG: biopolymer transporter ExbB [Bacteroidetes bacterium CG2_30_33_31]
MSGILLFLPVSEAVTAAHDSLTSAAAGVQGVGQEMSVWDLTLKGGFLIMVPLAIFSVLAIYIFVERFMATQKASKDDSNFMENIKDLIHDGKIDSAKDLCKSRETPLAKMIEKGLSRLGRPLPDINQAIETVGKLEVSKLEKNVTLLATISGASPMLGFLGTVTGMVRVFFDMANSGNNLNIALLSNGMYQAMVTTVAGLIVGIMGFVAYNIIVARIEKVVFILEARATEFMDLLHEPVK